jgi:hypothetical protein
MSSLMDLITDIENRLGWAPPEDVPLWKARASEHRKMTLGLARYGYTEKDLRLALVYCLRRHESIAKPMELFGYVARARQYARVDEVPAGHLDLAVRAALDWEANHPDARTGFWTSRLIRSYGPLRADTLQEWQEAGRG